MRRTQVLGLALAASALCALLLSCDSSSNSDGGIQDGGTLTCPLGADKSIDWATAVTLDEGKEVTGTVCPVKDEDWYKVTLPAGKKLLHVKLQNTVQTTTVKLTYTIFKVTPSNSCTDQSQCTKEQSCAGGKCIKLEIMGTAPTWSMSGIRTFDDFHCITEGTYYLVVKDERGDAKDGNNLYKLSYTTDVDKDPNESNNDMATAKAAGTAGAISCKGDLDYYKIALAADQLLEVKLTSGATKVNLKYSIYDDKNTLVGQDANPDGMKKTDMTTLWAVPKAGTYYVVVQDDGDLRSDPVNTYSLTLTPKAELDPQDKGARNDTPATATLLGSGPTGTWTKTGQIGSRGDLDYFKIDGLAGISENNPAVVEVTVDFGGASKVNPQVTLIYPHAATPCTKDSCCRVLNKACTNEFSCLRETYACIKKESVYCADSECVPTQTTTCPTEQACAGAVTCLPEKMCGAAQVSKFDENGADGAYIRTAQILLHPGPWYIRVDAMPPTTSSVRPYEYGKNYTLTVKMRMDPDGAKELNNEYLPMLVSTSVGTKDLHVNAAKKKAIKVAAGQTVTGYISYEGDQDWYVFDHPCPGADCNFSLTYKTTGSGCPTGANGAGLEFVYEIRRDDGDTFWGIPAESKLQSGQPSQYATGAYGYPTECMYALKGDTGSPYSYYLVVSDYKHNSWSWDCGYSVTISAMTAGCNAPCKVVNGYCNVP
jgi:hypothetical protein